MGKGQGCGASKAAPAARAVPPRELARAKSKKATDSHDPLHSPHSLAAAALIQSWYHGFKARLEIRRRLSWQVFTDIEYRSEVEQLGLNDFFADLDALKDALAAQRAITQKKRESAHVPMTASTKRNPDKMKHRATTRSNNHAANSAISAETEDLLLSRPNDPSRMSLQLVEDLIKGCRQDSTIPSDLVMSIIDETFVLQKQFGNIRSFNSRVAHRVTVVGDLHGQLPDLLTIFQMNGMPDDGNPYVFNGDLVDRGQYSVEILAIVFAFQLLYPHSVFVNRGNHEDYLMNKRYGFEKEVMKKYQPAVAAKLLRAFGAMFAALPFATLIDKHTLVIHAGISADMDLEMLADVQRQQFVSVLRAAKMMAKEPKVPGAPPTDTSLVVNAVWSDPGLDLGCTFNSTRGGGSVWGPDVTRRFLGKYGLKQLVRSHECKRAGYDWCHDNTVLTLFSASNYYTPGSNLGAFALFESHTHQPRLLQFNAANASNAPDQLTLNEQVSAVEKAAYHDVMKKVFQRKGQIIELYDKTKKRDGLITVSQWVKIMQDGTHLTSIPWRMMKNTFVSPDENGMINFDNFIDSFKVTTESVNSAMGGNAVQAIASKLYQHLGALEYIFRLIDEDNSGYISHSEFIVACKALSTFLGSDELDEDAAHAMAEAIDLDHNGQIEFNEFVESFRLIKTEKKRDSGQISPSPSAAQEHSYEVNGTKATS